MRKVQKNVKVLIIDNYDSFTYNLLQLVGGIIEGNDEIHPNELEGIAQVNGSGEPDVKQDAKQGSVVEVRRNDAVTIQEIEKRGYTHIILSPGPGRPADAGVCEDVIRHFAGNIPIFGVCLGHQAICEVAGATITYAKQVMHGKESVLTDVDWESSLFAGIAEADRKNQGALELKVARYHSLAADPLTIPENIKVIATAEDCEIMAVEYMKSSSYPCYGVQFHPESILTPQGELMIRAFLETE